MVPGRVRCVRTRLGGRSGVGWWWRLQGPEVDGRGSRVAGAGGLTRLLHRVAVVPGAFDRAQATAVPSFGIGPVRYLGQDRGQSHIPVFRGGKAAVPVAVRRTSRSVRVKLIRSGSMSAASAARATSTATA